MSKPIFTRPTDLTQSEHSHIKALRDKEIASQARMAPESQPQQDGAEVITRNVGFLIGDNEANQRTHSFVVRLRRMDRDGLVWQQDAECRIAELEEALREAIAQVESELAVVIECHTIQDDLETLDDLAQPFVSETQAKLARWRAALAATQPTEGEK